MKNIKFLLLTALIAFTFSACDDDRVFVDDNAAEGGLIDVFNILIPHIIASQTAYEANFRVFQGAVKTTSVDIYKQYQGALGTSNKVLLMSVPITGDTNASDHTISFTYADLANGVTLNGAAFPTDDEQLSVGDFFELTYVANTSAGTSAESGETTKVALSGRFAGVYEVIASEYWHPTAGFQGDWNGDEIVIESVDDLTYHILANGPFTTGQDPDNEFYFTINGDGDVIIPKEYNGAVQTVWSADEVANCINDAALLPDTHCGESNYTIKDDINGEDQVIMTHGYIRSSGTRQFYYELKKKI